MAEGRFSIRYQWLELDQGRIEGEELEASFARLWIELEGRSVIRCHRRSSGRVTASIKLPLHPLAEWIVRNWFYLFSEESSSRKKRDPDFYLRHDLSTGSEGYAFPFFYIAPFGEDLLHLEWGVPNETFHDLEFLEGDQAILPVASFREEVTAFIEGVLERLEEKGLHDLSLFREWEVLKELDPEELEFCRVAAAAGIDPFDPGEDERYLLQAKERLPSSLLHKLVNAMDPDRISEELQASVRTLKKLNETPGLTGLKDLRSEVLRHRNSMFAPEQAGWEAGYNMARSLRDVMKLNGQAIGKREGLKERFELSDDPEGIFYEEGFPRDVQVFGGMNQNEEVAFAISEKFQGHSERWNFVFCRALYEYFRGRFQEPGLVADLYDRSQQENRAFAAEFLAPASGIRKAIDGKIELEETDISELAEKFGVSTFVIEHQIRNHRIARIVREEGF